MNDVQQETVAGKNDPNDLDGLIDLIKRFGWAICLLLGAFGYKYFGMVPVIVFIVGYIASDFLINLDWDNQKDVKPNDNASMAVDEIPEAVVESPVTAESDSGIIVEDSGPESTPDPVDAPSGAPVHVETTPEADESDSPSKDSPR